MDKLSVNSEMMENAQQQDLRWFSGSFVLSQVLGIVAIILVSVWMGHFRGGFSWFGDPHIQFNYHPVFMVVGLVFLYANAIMIYRVFRNERKIRVKLLHAFLHLFAFVFVVIALKAAFDSHNLATPPIPNMYTLHSWLGITTVVLFSLQFAVGFISFLVPGLRMNLRAAYLPMHVFFGIGIFVLAVATALTGMTEKTIWALGSTYQTFPSEGVVVNCLGFTLVVFAFLVVYVVVNPNYKRRPLPEEEVPLVGGSHQH